MLKTYETEISFAETPEKVCKTGNGDRLVGIVYAKDINVNEFMLQNSKCRPFSCVDITVEEVVKIGKESKQILADLLNRHKQELYFKGKYLPHYDGWDRLLGTLYIKDLNITDYMIADSKCLKGNTD